MAVGSVLPAPPGPSGAGLRACQDMGQRYRFTRGLWEPAAEVYPDLLTGTQDGWNTWLLF